MLLWLLAETATSPWTLILQARLLGSNILLTCQLYLLYLYNKMEVLIESRQKRKSFFGCINHTSQTALVCKSFQKMSELQFSIKYSAAHSVTKFKGKSRKSRKIQGIQRKIVNSRNLFDTSAVFKEFKKFKDRWPPCIYIKLYVYIYIYNIHY